MGTFFLCLVLLSYSLLIQVHCQCERTQLVCADIVSTSTIWGSVGDGILLGSYTNEELQWIGCNNLGCSQAAFYCTQQATSMTFGSQDGYGMFALLGPGPIPSSYISGCCTSQIRRDVCGSPDEPQSVNKLCQQLGYKSGTSVSSVAFCCPGTLWSGSTWTSDFIQNQLSCSESITCIDPCTDSPTNNPTFIPTFHPTDDPTKPTRHPTYYPTTNTPTTNNPTTYSPTTIMPTTSIPTDSPSTDTPTDLPTDSPTIAPSTPLSGENKVITTEQQVTENINGLQSNGNGNNTNIITGLIIGILCFVMIVLGIFVFKLMKSRNDKVKSELSRVTSESTHTVVSSGSPVVVANNNFNANFGNHNMQNMLSMNIQNNNNIHSGYNVEGDVNNQTEMVPNLQMNMPPVIPPVVMTPMKDNDNEYSEDESQVDVVMKTTKGEFIDHDNAVIDHIDAHYQTAGKMAPPPPRVKKNMTEGNEIIQ
eukprot:13532_1